MSEFEVRPKSELPSRALRPSGLSEAIRQLNGTEVLFVPRPEAELLDKQVHRIRSLVASQRLDARVRIDRVKDGAWIYKDTPQ